MLTREQIAEKITQMGAGAATKWNTIAVSAMAGNEQAKAACFELAEVADTDERSMLIYYNIMSAAVNCMTYGERMQGADECEQALNALHNPQNDANKYLGNRLASLRKSAGMTQKELSKKSGVTLITLQKLENGANNLLRARTETTLALASALNVSVAELVQ